MICDVDIAGGEDYSDPRPPSAITQEMIEHSNKESKKYWTLGLIMGVLLGLLGNVFVSALFAYQTTNVNWYLVVAFGSAIVLIFFIWLMLKFLEERR